MKVEEENIKELQKYIDSLNDNIADLESQLKEERDKNQKLVQQKRNLEKELSKYVEPKVIRSDSKGQPNKMPGDYWLRLGINKGFGKKTSKQSK